jgi:hypothetical protein
MSGTEPESSGASELPAGKTRKPWFRPNRNGPGWHPSSWQGVLIVVVVVVAITAVIVLAKTGLL